MSIKKTYSLIVFLFLLGTCYASLASPISHTLRMPAPQTHYVEVTTRIDVSALPAKQAFVDFKMAAWTPGSYLIREFARNVEGVHADAAGLKVEVNKINKNTWRVAIPPAAKSIEIHYSVYAFEMSVRTSFVDDSHAYINPGSVFLYVDAFAKTPQSLSIIPFAAFKTVSTAMKETAHFTYEAKNLDEFIDSPIEIGNHQVLSFQVNNVPHQIAFYGQANIDTNKFVADVKKMCEEAQKVIGEHPCDHYLFIIHNLNRGGGGLEHLYSTTCQVTRSAYENAKGYTGIMNLLAHEYFHLWNIKRIRPRTLGPFDYEQENYTHNLWFSEGITSYYADLILERAGFVTKAEYLTSLADEISSVENVPGNKTESAASSSWDAWIKYYRPNENSRNSSVSYYDKGSLLGGVLNLWIIQSTQGKKHLDDVFAYLYQNYYKKLGRGFTDAELENAFSTIAGKSAKDLFASLIYGVNTPAYASLFESVGYVWNDGNAGKVMPYLGFNAQGSRVTFTAKGGPAYALGLNVGDEILKVNTVNFEGVDKLLADKKPGDTVMFVVKRDGLEKTYLIPVQQSPLKSFSLTSLENPSKGQLDLRAKWLGTK